MLCSFTQADRVQTAAKYSTRKMESDGGSGNKPMQVMHVETTFRTRSKNGTKSQTVSIDSPAGIRYCPADNSTHPQRVFYNTPRSYVSCAINKKT
jgi:hypothetical protein